MAITPEEALGSKLEAEKELIERLEESIDRQLVDKYNGRSIVHIDAPKANEFVRNEIKKRFESSGWSIKISESQMDGSIWQFFKREMSAEDYYNK